MIFADICKLRDFILLKICTSQKKIVILRLEII